MPEYSDYGMHASNEEDRIFLSRKSFNVSIRLLKLSQEYKKLIHQICSHIAYCCELSRKKPLEITVFSGAEAGIPFNIIAYNLKEETLVLINPEIKRHTGNLNIIKSNCSSVDLAESINVKRFEFIDIFYYDIEGNYHEMFGIGKLRGGFAIQHAIDHNNGILITDK